MDLASAGRACPRCRGALERRRLWDVGLDVCVACRFVGIDQVELSRLLEDLSAAVRSKLDPDAELRALPDRSAEADCPRCHRAMERADYCEAKLVFFRRCEPCGLLWVGNDELATMSVMWARMEKRGERRKARITEDLALMDLLWFAQDQGGGYV
jgi:Zn-finger nucleic acid-binding protein